LTNEYVGGAAIRSEGDVVAEDGEDAVSVVVVVVGIGRLSERWVSEGGVEIGGGSCVGSCSWVSWSWCSCSCSWVSCSWCSCSWGWSGSVSGSWS
jgi:hypothetical protein